MKTYLKTFLLVFFTFSLTTCNSQENKKGITNLNGKIKNELIRSIIEENVLYFPNNTQISIGLISENSTEYIGIIRKNDTLQITDNRNTIFEIGSITKVFTSVLLSDFVDKKQASLNENLAEQFKFKLKEGREITLEQLANHTAGLERMPSNFRASVTIKENPYTSYTPALLKKYLLKEIKLKNKTGEKSEYSNLGVGLLGYILTKKSNKSYEEILQERIFKPLKMTNSSTDLTKIDKHLLVKGLDKKGNEASNWGFTDALIAAGGIKSSIIDLEKFVRKNFENDAVYNLPQQPTVTISKTRKIGLGWHIFSKSNIIWHSGATGGYKSCLAILKKEKKAVVVLSNVSGFNKQNIDILCFNLLKVLKNKTQN